MKKHIFRLLSFLLLFGVLYKPQQVLAKEKFYVVDEKDNLVLIPKSYTAWGSIRNLGETGFMNHPEDIFIDKKGYLYVADTENNRVLKMNKNGEVFSIYTEAFGSSLKKPKGVYVHTDDSIWIADTGNLRIVVIDQNGNDIKTFGKPDSSLLDASFNFDPEKIYLNSMGYVYALKGANLMSIDQQNEFHGYIGASKVNFSLNRVLIRMFGSQAQIERTLKQEPTSYSNFMIANDGMIYGVLATETSNQIRRLNSVGNNTYPMGNYGLTIEMEGQEKLVKPFFSDLAVAENGIITLIDKNTGLLCQYDQQGNLLTTFGGLGEYEGVYQIPVSIAVDAEGFLYVLDYSTNSITILEPTQFIQLVHQAVTYHEAGEYALAMDYWKKVLTVDSNYSLAHKGIAKVLMKEENWEGALNEYKIANDKVGFSSAYSEFRHEYFRQNFTLVVVLVFGGLFISFKCYWFIKNKASKWAKSIEFGGDL